MTRTRILLLALAVIAFTLCACLDDGDWGDWQGDVLERQRHEGQPGPETPVPEEVQ